MRNFFLVTFFVMNSVAYGQATFERDVTLEIEPIEGAQSYEVELKKTPLGEVLQSKVREPKWNGRLSIGFYEMRNRSIDLRGVAGHWSQWEAFEVGLDKPNVNATIDAEVVENLTTLHFQWAAVEGATRYSVEIKGAEGAFNLLQNVETPPFDQKVPANQKYKWKVVALGPENLTSEVEGELDLSNGPLEAPVIAKPINSRNPQIVWSSSPDAQTFEIKLERYLPKQKRWESLFTTNTGSREGIALNPQFPDGIYRVTIIAQAESRAPSPAAVANFRVKRTIQAPPSGPWYARAAISVDAIKYNANNVEGSSTGETFGLELGRLKSGDRWGVSLGGEFSMFSNDGQSLNSNAAQLSLLRRDILGTSGELVSSLAAAYKSMPVPNSSISALGPAIGLRYSQKLSSAYGLHFGIRIDDSLMSLKTPNGESMESSLSYSADLLFSRRWNRQFIGYIGYRRKDDQLRYQATGGVGTSATSIRADSLNIIFEYDF